MLSKRDFQKKLIEAVIDPRLPGQHQFAFDQSSEYLRIRVLELLNGTTVSAKDFDDVLKRAIYYLNIARLKLDPEAAKTKRRPRSKNPAVDNQLPNS